MINDLPCNVISKTVIYADDTTFLCQNSDVSVIDSLNHDVFMKALERFTVNAFLLNEVKTKYLLFSNKIYIINNSSDSTKFLGIMLDTSLTWSEHINDLTLKLSRVIYLLRNLVKLITSSYVRCVYFSFFNL